MPADQDAFAKAAAARGHALVVVAGDVGRSPRMQYHALSLAGEGRAVTLVGYAGERCIDALVQHVNVREVRVPEPRRFSGFLGRVYRLIALMWALGRALFRSRRDYRASLVLCQTPPALPALFLCWLVAHRDGATVVADWHNLGHTVLADACRRRKGRLSFTDRVAVAIYDYLERKSGSLLDAHLCVTHALKAWLSRNYGLTAVTAHDRPPAMFTSLSEGERLAALARIGSRAFPSTSEDPFWRGRSLADASKDRPTLVASSTSWSADEDFDLLLDALIAYDKAQSRRLVVIVTGKGELRRRFEERYATLNLKSVRIATAWLSTKDYCCLLACADVGVSLHASTSGLDLPMKVVDMFGVGLPVLQLNFPCVSELVEDGANGVLFEDAASLARELAKVSGRGDALQKLRAGAGLQERWGGMWARCVAPVVGPAF
jgi:beta-1,4-mannosyltransferase